jgi:hypothetical protein
MNEIIAAILLASAHLQGPLPLAGSGTFETFVRSWQHSIADGPHDPGHFNSALGYCATIPKGNSGTILLGEYTTAPPGVDGFVNLGNVWCGLRSTGEQVACPPPISEADCKAAQVS